MRAVVRGLGGGGRSRVDDIPPAISPLIVQWDDSFDTNRLQILVGLGSGMLALLGGNIGRLVDTICPSPFLFTTR